MGDANPDERHARVLVVEDEHLISDIVIEALSEQGFAVSAVDNARDALRCLQSESRIDVLFTDVNLAGGMDGAALARLARVMRPDLPVVYTSGRQSRIEHLDPVDGSMFVPKPYDPFSIGPLFDYMVAAKKITRARERA